ncbi:uncharacterized protein TM35_000015130 [Trypanosoma theileri]|uniref:Uncharacterized protein n=1 Tax=Trypanosoma theileri TaxID=67003 RepID=A0A1X0P9P7_9TRYP|nr:uncharacterized protein TM35_000015130 [Trypanosoma theileri]ORC93636.1 hypothetical protein TM35_000015130 [Trypanosoma theileri]
MSFRYDKDSVQTESFVTPGETYRILAPSSSLREHLTDSYWCSAMEEVCDGKLDGVAVRYTGRKLVLMQFRPKHLSPAGYRYPLSMSIPVEYLVPVVPKSIGDNVSMGGSFHSYDSSETRGSPGTLSRLCVVCGRFNVPGMVLRNHGYKCRDCVGKKSDPRLRTESARYREEDEM